MLLAGGLEDRPVIDALHALCSEFRCAALGSVSKIISDQCEEVIVNWRVVFHGVWAAHRVGVEAWQPFVLALSQGRVVTPVTLGARGVR